MLRNSKLIYTIFFYLYYSLYCFSNNNSQFINYSTSEGLIHKTVNCIIQDKDGFIWIGTTTGLSRFDGYSFKNYTNNTESKNSLHGTEVIKIEEGKNGVLWLSTDLGLECFNKSEETSRVIEIDELKGTCFQKDFSIDENGLVWVFVNNSKFVAYDPANNKIVQTINSIPGFDIRKVYHFIIDNNTLLISSVEGIFSYNYKTQHIHVYEKSELPYCYSIHKSGNSSIVVSFTLKGVYIINSKDNNGYWITNKDLAQKTDSKPYFYDVEIGADNTIWIGMAPGIVSIKNSKEIKYYNAYSKSNYFGGDIVSCILTDKDNNVWCGTYENGIYLRTQSNQNFRIFNKLYKDEIEKTIVAYMHVFDDKSLIYSDHQALYYCKDYNNLSEDCAQRIYDYSSANIYPIDGKTSFVNCVDTLFLYDSQSGKLKKLLISGATSYVVKDKNGVVWLGTWTGIIHGFDLKNNREYFHYTDRENRSSIPVFMMYVDDDNSLWIASLGAGLIHILDPSSENSKVEQFGTKKAFNNSINSNLINCLHGDDSGNIWIGTNGAGLYRYEKKSGEFESFSTKNGLMSNVIESVISDKTGNIWFASNVLTKYDIVKKTFTHFTKYDGVVGAFPARSGFRSVDNKLLFANSNGILGFDPQIIPDKNDVATPLLTNLKIRGITLNVNEKINNKTPYSKSITYSDELNLPFEFNSFSIEFSSIEFQLSHAIMYEYKLEGIDMDWISTDSRNRIASYSGLQPGRYKFSVRASNSIGNWCEPKTLIIDIIPPWWKTLWFRYGAILFFVFLISSLIFIRYRSIKIQNKILEQQVNFRTQKLVQSNEMLKENQLVVEMKNAQLNEVMKSKNKLISMLAHDFKNALSGILGISTILHQESENVKSEKIHKFSEAIMKSSNSLVSQMMTLLDWVQSQDADMEANPIDINLEVILNDAIDLEKGNATRKEIDIFTQIDYSSNAFVDPRMVSLIIRNLLSNAIKFTHKGGSVIAMIQETISGIDVAIIDTGVGMTQEVVDNLFDEKEKNESTRGTDNEIGRGLGLKLCKIFVEKNAGKLSVVSQSGIGSTFTVSLPKANTKATTKSPIESFVVQNKEIKRIDRQDLFTVLIIEDNNEVLESINSVFDKNYSVIKALDGQIGLNFALQMLPDIIISDIDLPGKSGVEICSGLKKNPLTNHIPIILITSHTADEMKDIAYNSGANDFIEKPLNPVHLIKKVESLLDYRDKIGKKVRENVSPNLPDNYEDKIIKKVIEFVNENISEVGLSTNMIVDRLSISRTQLWRVFKTKTGKSLSDFIFEIRMQKATQMLLTGKYRISEIAYELGYSNPRYFTHCFTKEFGMSPTEYAEKVKQNLDL